MESRYTKALAPIGRLLVVITHPHDESFGLGAIIDQLTARAVPTAVLCFTHGEASTLRARPGELRRIRTRELADAAEILGIKPTAVLDYPDGSLASAAPTRLSAHVAELIGEFAPTHLLAFDSTGVTGHTDHVAATEAAVQAAGDAGLPVLGWTLPQPIAEKLNTEFGTHFRGRVADDIGFRVPVSRQRQLRAIAAHVSQSRGNAVLQRRLALLGDVEYLRWLSPPRTAPN